ncbi:protein of unknown function [Methylorubrum extorquens]|uniref:Uncharacterized protein n=1 Tax=Methylorubrum extorquens TaxID=408 RepID=A0A2N9AK22_METEX|nr:protein of unknown function [Methylorubrum extorquens]
MPPDNDDELDRRYDATPLALPGHEQTRDLPRHDEAVVSNIFEKEAVVYLADHIDIVVAPDLERVDGLAAEITCCGTSPYRRSGPRFPHRLYAGLRLSRAIYLGIIPVVFVRIYGAELDLPGRRPDPRTEDITPPLPLAERPRPRSCAA